MTKKQIYDRLTILKIYCDMAASITNNDLSQTLLWQGVDLEISKIQKQILSDTNSHQNLLTLKEKQRGRPKK